MLSGFQHISDYLAESVQQILLAEIRNAVSLAPLFTPRMPRTGHPFSVQMTNCGELGWVSSKEEGYRYQSIHPEIGEPWPSLPNMLINIWDNLTEHPVPPQACLINYYGPNAKMGLHRDEDEEDFSAPVLSISLGDTARFRLGGLSRKDPTRSFELKSGDVIILGGNARLAYHGVDRILPGTSDLLDEGGRFNLTLRCVKKSTKTIRIN